MGDIFTLETMSLWLLLDPLKKKQRISEYRIFGHHITRSDSLIYFWSLLDDIANHDVVVRTLLNKAGGLTFFSQPHWATIYTCVGTEVVNIKSSKPSLDGGGINPVFLMSLV